ncbi:MAG TPA: hypothetical protein VIJ57_01300 [Hanamia sp.]
MSKVKWLWTLFNNFAGRKAANNSRFHNRFSEGITSEFKVNISPESYQDSSRQTIRRFFYLPSSFVSYPNYRIGFD